MDSTIPIILDKCDKCLKKNDKNGAKSWMLTASTLYPRNFAIHMKALCLYKSGEDLNGAVRYLEYIIREFPDEPELWGFLRDIAVTLLSSDPPQEPFRDVFLEIPKEIQKNSLCEAALHIEDLMQKAQIYLVLMRYFPEAIPTYGLQTLDILVQGASTVSQDVLINPFKKVLVCDVLPLLLECPDIVVDKPIISADNKQAVNQPPVTLKTGHLCQWLELATNFYTIGTEISFKTEIEEAIFAENGWTKLHHLLCLLAKKCQWPDIAGNTNLGPSQLPMVRWHALEELSGQKKSSRETSIGSFYLAVLLFFQTAWEYFENVFRLTQAGQPVTSTNSNTSPGFIVIQGQSYPIGHGYQNEMPLELNTGNSAQELRIKECLLASSNCWNFLNTDKTYSDEFQRIIHQWGIEDWQWINLFLADMLIFNKAFKEASIRLQYEEARIKEASEKVLEWRIKVQNAFCELQVGEHDSTGMILVKILKELLSQRDGKYVPPTVFTPTRERNSIHLILSCFTELVPYVLHLLIVILRTKIFSTAQPNLTLIGHLLILIQFDWHNELETFLRVMEIIKQQPQFTYYNLVKYLFNVDLLKEIMYIANMYNEGKVKLTILPKSKLKAAKLIKEDIRVCLEKQVCLTQTEISIILSTFLHEGDLF